MANDRRGKQPCRLRVTITPYKFCVIPRSSKVLRLDKFPTNSSVTGSGGKLTYLVTQMYVALPSGIRLGA